MAERYAFRVTAVFAADSDGHAGVDGAAFFDGHFDELSGAFPVENRKRILLEYSFVNVLEQKFV